MSASVATLATILAGLAVTALLAGWSVGRESKADSVELARGGELLLYETESLFERISVQLRATAGLFRADEAVTQSEFRTFVADLGSTPGLVGIGYVPVVSGAQLSDWLETVRDEVPGYELTEQAGAAESSLYFPVVYFEPLADTLVGFDLGARAQWLELVDHLAVDSVTMSGYLEEALPEPVGGDRLILAVQAITVPDTVLIHELVVAVVDVSELIDENAAPVLLAGFNWSLADTTEAAAQAESQSDSWQGSLTAGGRDWLLSVSVTSNSHWLDGATMLIVAAGVAITGLLGLVVALVIGRIAARSEVKVLESINAGKDDFLAAVSHRLRTPLTSVVGFSEVLRDNAGAMSDGDRQDLVSTIAVQAIELGHLFDNLLTVTRQSDRFSFIPGRVDLAVETSAVLDTAEPAVRDKVQVYATENDVVAAGDAALVRQILRNLLSNAADFGDEVEVEVLRDGLVARVCVRDNGPGIPPNRVANAFALYGSRGEVGQPDSMGVGLFVSRRLARRMSGDLVYRRSHGWTRFELTLPVLPATVVIEPTPETVPTAP